MAPATIFGDADSVIDAIGDFFTQLGQLSPLPLLAGLVLFQAYLLLRSRALFNAMRAAYPDDEIQMRRIWGAYVAAVGINNITPAGGGNLVQYVFTRDAVPSATYPVVVVALLSSAVFDAAMSALVIVLCFTTTHAFPHLAQIAGLSSFDVGLYLEHPLVLTSLGLLLAGAIFYFTRVDRARAAAAWRAIHRGTRILRGDRYIVRMVGWQTASWAARAASCWYMLLAFRIGATPGRVLDVLGATVLAAIVPFTPSGVGIQQALIVAVFTDAAISDRVAAFSVGQQLAYAVCTIVIAAVALSKMFGVHGFRRAVREARHRRAQTEPVPGAPHPSV